MKYSYFFPFDMFRSFVGPTLGGFLNDKLGFEWAATIQGGWPLLSVSDQVFLLVFSAVSVETYYIN